MAKRSKNAREPPIFSTAYCSRVAKNLGGADIESIVSVARIKNSRQKITGWLVCGSGIFFQWLEGSREDVKRLMDTIIADTRHDTIVVLSESEDVRERLFGDWDMELVSAEDIREVLIDAISETKDPKSLGALRRLVKEVDSGGLNPVAGGQKPGLISNLIDL
jgi:hypothetical protein